MTVHLLIAQVDIVFGVYATEDGQLKYRDLLYSMRKREGNMIYAKQMFKQDPTSEKSLYACLRGCLMGED